MVYEQLHNDLNCQFQTKRESPINYFFKEYPIREAFNDTKQDLSQMKQPNAQRDEPEKPENKSNGVRLK